MFLRNVPTSVTSEDLKKAFSKYGKLKWARVVTDKKTGTSKGTAFIKYMDSAIAQKLI
jgi:RNA recognition motif-containing protein